MPQCCNNLYNSDLYCPTCGDKVHHTNTVKSAFEIDPTITESFHSHGEPFTGQVIDTYYYRRKQTNITYGYIWLTLEDTNKEIKKFNISGEGKKFQNIKKGDVLSIISPHDISLNYPIASGDSHKIENNIAPAIVTYHCEDDTNYSSIDSLISDPVDASPAVFNCILVAAASIGAAWYLYTEKHIDIENPWFIGACVIPFICFLLASRTHNIDKKNSLRAQTAADSLDKLENIFYSDLGYEKSERPTSSDDVLCPSCNHAINSQAQHCCQCGAKVKTETVIETPDLTNTSDNLTEQQDNCNAASSIELNSSPTNNTIKTVKEHNKAISSEFEVVDEHTFIYKHTLTTNKEHTVYCSANLVKVVAKDMGANSDSGNIVTSRTTNYRNQYGTIVDSKTDVTYTPYRNLILAGYLTVENAEGEQYAVDADDYVLRASNVGDLLYIGECTLKRQETYQKFLEYVYHVNNDEIIHGHHSYQKYVMDTPFMSSFNCVLVMLLSIPTVGIPLIFITIVTMIFSSSNNAHKSNAIYNMKNTLKKCVDNRVKILEGFK